MLDQALLAGETWTRSLGAAPRGSAASVWRRHASTVAAYRDRYYVVGSRTLGQPAQSTAQRQDERRALAALGAAQRLAYGSHVDAATHRAAAPSLPPMIHRL